MLALLLSALLATQVMDVDGLNSVRPGISHQQADSYLQCAGELGGCARQVATAEPLATATPDPPGAAPDSTSVVAAPDEGKKASGSIVINWDAVSAVGSLLSALASIASAFLAFVALVVAAIGGVLAYRQLHIARSTAHATLLLQLDKLIREYDTFATNLIPPQNEIFSPYSPKTTEERHMLRTYMALFEQINILETLGVLEISTVNALYGYRIRRLCHTTRVRTRLKEYTLEWRNFIDLWRKIAAYRRERLDETFTELVAKIDAAQWQSPAPPADTPPMTRDRTISSGD